MNEINRTKYMVYTNVLTNRHTHLGEMILFSFSEKFRLCFFADTLPKLEELNIFLQFLLSFISPTKQRIFNIYKGEKIQTQYLFFYFKTFFSQNWIIRWYYWGSDGSLDNKFNVIFFCHMRHMTFYVILRIWQKMMR